jgi:DNA polymerase I
MSRWLILDGTYLCHRAMHSTGPLTHNGRPTGVIYGFFRDLKNLTELFQPDGVVACFDEGKGLREQEFPYYKKSRRERVYTEAEQDARYDMFIQRNRIMEELEELGLCVAVQKGYEADDLIAQACIQLGQDSEIVIVGSDSDLLQLVGFSTSYHNIQSKKTTNLASFREEWGIFPFEWAFVKAVAGCATDDVPGAEGVGEKTAAKFFAQTLKQGKKYGAIEAFRKTQQYQDNKKLVSLPFEGTRVVPLAKSTIWKQDWKELCKRHGLDSLARG